MRTLAFVLGSVVSAALLVPALPAAAAGGYSVKVTCSVPKSQPERQLAPNSCMNYAPDGTQTFTAHVRTSSGRPASGVWVQWSDSDNTDAKFRTAQNPCKTGSKGHLLRRTRGQPPEARREDHRDCEGRRGDGEGLPQDPLARSSCTAVIVASLDRVVIMVKSTTS